MMAILSGLAVAIGIGLLIFVHELGHFLVAKKVGIRVEAFSLGFGPRIFGFVRGDTDYKICAIPLGGYVKMAGEAPGEGQSGDPGDFASKTISQRAWVVSAGVIMNVLFAFIAFPIAFSIGVDFTSPEIGWVAPRGPAWAADLRANDRILSVNGNEVISFEDIQTEIAFTSRGTPATFEIERDGQKITREVSPRHDKGRGINLVDMRPKMLMPTFKDDWDGAASHGIGVHDQIVEVNGYPTRLFDPSLLVTLEENYDPQAPLNLLMRRSDGFEYEVSLPPMPDVADQSVKEWNLGVSAATIRVAAIVKSSDDHPTWAAKLGIKPDDQITHIHGQPVRTAQEIRRALVKNRGQQPLKLTVERPGLSEAIELTHEGFSGDAVFALLECMVLEATDVRLVIETNSPAERAGLQDGDLLKKCGDLDFSPTDHEFVEKVIEVARKSDGAPLVLVVRRGEADVVLTLTPEPARFNRWTRHLEPTTLKKFQYRDSFPHSMVAGFHQTVNQGKNVLMSLKSFLTGTVGTKNLGGIILIAQATYSFVEQGFARILFFLAILSLNLAVLNILPIPVLDGGHLVFLAIEKIKGSPLSEKWMGYLTWAGMIALLALMLFATFNDIRRIIS